MLNTDLILLSQSKNNTVTTLYHVAKRQQVAFKRHLWLQRQRQPLFFCSRKRNTRFVEDNEEGVSKFQSQIDNQNLITYEKLLVVFLKC